MQQHKIGNIIIAGVLAFGAGVPITNAIADPSQELAYADENNITEQDCVDLYNAFKDKVDSIYVSQDGSDVPKDEYWITPGEHANCLDLIQSLDDILSQYGSFESYIEYCKTQDIPEDEEPSLEMVYNYIDDSSRELDRVKRAGIIDTSISKGQTGSGNTELTVKLANTNQRGGTDDPTNPDKDGDGLGDNIAFTVPSKINFVVKPDGGLTSPSQSLMYIENESVFNVIATALKVTEYDGWNVVEDASKVLNDGTESTKNNVSVEITPNNLSTGKINIANFVDKITELDGKNHNEWAMKPKIDSSAVIADRVMLGMDGTMSNVTKDISSPQKFAELEWYLSPGDHSKK